MTSEITSRSELSDTQLLLLSKAAQRDDRLVVVPDNLKGAVAQQVLRILHKRELIQEVSTERGEPSCRTSTNGKPIGFVITNAGRLAIGLPPEAAGGELEGQSRADAEPAAASKAAHRHSGPAQQHGEAIRAPRDGSKQALLIALLSRNSGASLAEVVSAMGWLAHTSRAALTRLRQSGYPVGKIKGADGRAVYRIETAARKSSGDRKVA